MAETTDMHSSYGRLVYQMYVKPRAEANPDYHERLKANCRKYAQSEKGKAREKAYREANREHIRERDRQKRENMTVEEKELRLMKERVWRARRKAEKEAAIAAGEVLPPKPRGRPKKNSGESTVLKE